MPNPIAIGPCHIIWPDQVVAPHPFSFCSNPAGPTSWATKLFIPDMFDSVGGWGRRALARELLP
jgi:hypothetical protein